MDEQSFRVRLFGPIEVLVDGQTLPRLRSRKALWLLALLILRGGRPVQREWLATILWPDADQAAGLANLRTNLSELRSALGAEGKRLQTTDRHTISLEILDADIDVTQFDQAIKRATSPTLSVSIELYRGPLLEGCSEEWVHQERAARERDCLGALEKLGKAALRDGDFANAERWYRRAILIDPWWDGARRGLMEALANSGDVNEALQVYRSFDALLRSDSASVPDKQTTALYLRLRSEASQQDPLLSSQGSKTSSPGINGRLPHPITELVGREDERIEVAGLLRSSRLVTLTGFGGIGKTRLALDVVTDIAREYPDGVWLIPLDAITAPQLLPKQLTLVLGLSDRPGQSSFEVACEYLRDKRLLLVLDNCEHLHDSVAELATSLLQECRGVKLLATSREPLGITGEVAWLVPSLAVPDPEHLPSGAATLERVLMAYDGVRLFVERAQAARRDFRLRAENAQLVVKICAALEGIPLAIEIAAARTNAMSLDRMFEGLYDLIGAPGPSKNGGVPRHNTMHAAVDWSHELLSDAERTLLRRLSIFSGGWTLEAAEKVCTEGLDSASILNYVSALVQKSLVVFDDSNGEPGGRYRLLEAVRQFADAKLGKANERETTAQRHLTWCIELAEEAMPFLLAPGGGTWVARLEAERGNFGRALQWSMSEKDYGADAQRLVASLWKFWHTQGNCREGLRYIDGILANTEVMPAELCKLLLAKGSLNYRGSNPQAAKGTLERARDTAMEVGDKYVAAEASRILGGIANCQLDTPSAIRYYRESTGLFEEIGDLKSAAFTRLREGLCSFRERGQTYDTVRPFLENSILEFRELGDPYSLKWALDQLCNFAKIHGDFALAQALLEEVLRINHEIGDKVGSAWAIFHLGTLAESQSDLSRAEIRYEECLRLFRDHVGGRGTAWSLLGLGNIAIDRREYGRARAFYLECLNIFETVGETSGVSHTLIGLAIIERVEGNLAESYSLLARSLQITHEVPDSHAAAEALSEMAALLMVVHQMEEAVKLYAAASAVQKRLGYTPYAHDKARIDEEIGQARSVLDEEAFRGSWHKGEAMSWNEAVGFALAQSVPNPRSKGLAVKP